MSDDLTCKVEVDGEVCGYVAVSDHGMSIHKSRAHGVKGKARAKAKKKSDDDNDHGAVHAAEHQPAHADAGDEHDAEEQEPEPEPGREVSVVFNLDPNEEELFDVLKFLYGWADVDLVCAALNDLFDWARTDDAVKLALRALKARSDATP